MLRTPLRLRTCEPWWHAGNGWSKSLFGYFDFAEILTAGRYNPAFSQAISAFGQRHAAPLFVAVLQQGICFSSGIPRIRGFAATGHLPDVSRRFAFCGPAGSSPFGEPVFR